MNRAFVTGATGFVGSALVRALLAEGTAVRVLARSGASRENLDGLDLDIVTGDLADEDALARAIDGCAEVYHCAALYRFWARDPGEFTRTNVTGAESVVRAAVRAGATRIVYTSSVATVKPLRGGIADESRFVDPADAPGPYKRSKILGEAAVLRLAREAGAPVVVVNPSAPIGPRDVKPTPTGRLVLDFLEGRLPAYVDTGLNLVDVDACAHGHLLAARGGVPGERYILGGENLSLHAILETLGALTGLPAPRVRLPHSLTLAAGHVSEALARLTGREPRVPLEAARSARHPMYFSGERARRELGFESPPAAEALERAVRWFIDTGRARRRVARITLPERTS